MRTITERTRRSQASDLYGAQSATVIFTVATGQPSSVHVATGGGEADDPYIAVRVGECLTYVYDRAALDSHVNAWREAARHASRRTLAEHGPDTHIPQDLAVSVTTRGPQPFSACSQESADGMPELAVQVGSVTVRVTTTAALLSYLSAWNRARHLAAVFNDPRMLGDLAIADE